ncbi:MAG: hypothetical protein AAF202_06015, partial [Pseudomonadota bacterium]
MSDFDQIEQFIQAGRKDQALVEIEKLIKRQSLEHLDRVQLSRFYLWLSEPMKALKILGNVVSLEDSSKLSVEARVALIKKLDMMHFFGAHFLVGSWLESSSVLDLMHSNAEIARVMSRLALTMHNYKLASDAADCVLKQSEEVIDHLLLADSMEGLGKSEKAIEYVKGLKPKTLVLEAIVSQVLHEYLVKSGEFLKADEQFAIAQAKFEKLPDSKDKAYLYQWHAVRLGLDQRVDEALKALHKCFEMIGEDIQPSLEIALLFWKGQWGELDFEERTRLYLAPLYSPYRSLLRPEAQVSKFPMHPWFEAVRQKLTPRDQFDCVTIGRDGESFELSTYKETKNKKCLDLVSGVFHRADEA